MLSDEDREICAMMAAWNSTDPMTVRSGSRCYMRGDVSLAGYIGYPTCIGSHEGVVVWDELAEPRPAVIRFQSVLVGIAGASAVLWLLIFFLWRAVAAVIG